MANLSREEVLAALRFNDSACPAGLKLYMAGLPHFRSNFSRDSIIAGLLLEDWPMLRDQLLFSAQLQGRGCNQRTAEEPGKIHHEYPEVLFDDYSTLYNACDTTSLYLLGIARYYEATQDQALVKQLNASIGAAIRYIEAHLIEDLFYESPKFAEAQTFANKVTYWKDTILLDRPEGIPAWPVVYSLAHICALSALRQLSRTLPEFAHAAVLAQRMRAALSKLWDRKLGQFYVAIDAAGPVSALSSDSLHALYYLEREDLEDSWLSSIGKGADSLATEIGFRTLAESESHRTSKAYHFHSVWPFEQALIHAGAVKFGLDSVLRVAERIRATLEDSLAEVYAQKEGRWTSLYCDPQLWSLAAREYFRRV
jgi:glycogen debranching enzyme